MLRISSKTRYSIRIMLYLSRHALDVEPARKQDIAESEKISADYVEQILIRLRGGGLVISHRGARGGFTLARESHAIRVLDVVEAVEGAISFLPEDEAASQHPATVVTSRLWLAVQQQLADQLGNVTLADLVDEVRELQHGSQLTYDI